jgi:hypothetical protein
MVTTIKNGVESSSLVLTNTEKLTSIVNGLVKPVEEIVPPSKPKPTIIENIFGKVPPSKSDGILSKFGDNKIS